MKQSQMALNCTFLIQWSPGGSAIFLRSPGLCSGKDDHQKLLEINKINVWILHL